MSNPIIKIHDASTQEVIEREMTQVEFIEYLKNQKKDEQKQAQIEAKEAARQVILDKLGISAEEAKILLS